MSTDQAGDKPNRINVLSIDGGGIRGIIPAMVLAEIESRTGKRVCQLFDIIAGTSTGGILALGLSKPKSTGSHEPAFTASQLVELYENNGQVIFPKNRWGKLGNMLRAQYPSSGIEKLLDEYFGDSRLKDALTTVIITSYDIENRNAFFFRSANAQIERIQASYDYPMKYVARATSAAPTYFPPAKISKGTSAEYWALVDGGVFANNPAMCAYVEALKLNPDTAVDDHICLVSLGTGQSKSSIPYEKAKGWGLTGWARPIIDIALEGPGDSVDYQLSKVLKRDYYRLQTELTGVSNAMDNVDPSNIQDLKKLAQKMISDQNEHIEKACAKLLENKFYPLSNKAIAAACNMSSQEASHLLRNMNLAPDLYQELFIDGERKKCYAPEVLDMAKAVHTNHGPASKP